MKIFEVIGELPDVEDITAILLFIKSKGVDEIPMKSFVKELYNRGIIMTGEDLIPILNNIDVVDDVSADIIKFNGSITDSKPKKDFDMAKERVSQMAKSSLNRKDDL